jgi:hypothetical protein
MKVCDFIVLAFTSLYNNYIITYYQCENVKFIIQDIKTLFRYAMVIQSAVKQST